MHTEAGNVKKGIRRINQKYISAGYMMTPRRIT